MAPSDPSDLRRLDTLVESSVSLLKQLQVALAEIHRDPTISSTNSSTDDSASAVTTPPPVDILALARDSASLLRAHSTKLSLLIVNKPFTPTAILSVLRDLASGPVPGLAASVEQCQPNKYTAIFRRELAWRCRSVLQELTQLLQKIPLDGKSLSSATEGFGQDGKGSIALTGVLWSACDDVVKLSNMGIGGFLAQQVGEWRDTLKDVMEELKEWGDEEEDDDEGTGDVDALADELGESHISSTQDMLDDLMNSHETIPKSDPDRIRPRLESSLRRLRLVTLLYQAIIKRRIRQLPPMPTTTDAAGDATSISNRLDEVVTILKTMPDRFGDLACAFYELDPEEIDSLMDQCFLDAFAAGQLLSPAWGGGRDEFSEWVDKFHAEIKKE